MKKASYGLLILLTFSYLYSANFKDMTNIEEIWKDVVGYEGLYQISSFGNVRSLEREVWSNNQWGKYLRYCPAKTLKNVLHPNGYYRVDLCGKLHSNHHLVAIAFIGCQPDKKEVNHKDGDKLNNHFINLEWVTKSENIRHADKNGLRTMPKGKDHYMFGRTGEKHHNFGKKWRLNATI
jgi:hypothetical protein